MKWISRKVRSSKENKLRITFKNGEIEISGNRSGLKYLANICLDLSKLSKAAAETSANHYHLLEGFRNLEK